MISDIPDLMGQWRAYSKDFRDVHQFHHRINLPIRLGKARLIRSHSGRVFYTHAYLNRQITDLPTTPDWLSDGDVLWLMDVVWDRSLTPRQAIEALSNDVIDQDLAMDGERVAFWRGVHARFGSGVARKRDLPEHWRVAI